MAHLPMTSKVVQSNANPFMNKAISVASNVMKGISIANTIREAAPVVMGGLRAAAAAFPIVL